MSCARTGGKAHAGAQDAHSGTRVSGGVCGGVEGEVSSWTNLEPLVGDYSRSCGGTVASSASSMP
jgi:hypothetical protein